MSAEPAIAAVQARANGVPISPELAAVYDRVVAGIGWLVDHDEAGAFHFWFESGIGPRAPMPAQDETKRAAYAEYHKARTLWEQLWSRMERLEALATKEAAKA